MARPQLDLIQGTLGRMVRQTRAEQRSYWTRLSTVIGRVLPPASGTRK
jgi:hypothetical protein